ncbi:hypothetical protein AJ80_05656 [Polytolypa hystricis UAMH7299]|uniref:Short-chain dehydrogenase/reductase 3 n=1 Tax=Polytolypa hystricis (strain UAMH7299) TaxID=1447883 RepID=A0A2B7XTQ2_POLH7|nr:hypothetical protein AJ80_05656 [Polytolypa hystricis UAMH7299]
MACLTSREGFTADVVGGLLQKTVLNPALALPLFLLARYTTKGQSLAGPHPKYLKALKVFASLGVARYVNGWLNQRALNNGVSDKYDWPQEIAVVTGGSDGIGQRITLLLAKHGLKVVILDVQPPKYKLPSNVTYFHCDICSPEAVAKAAADIRATVGGDPSILINNAGVLKGKTILEGTEELTRQTFEVNTLSHYRLAREFLPAMISRNHGMVVTVASQAALVVSANMVDYSASKAAAVAFHEGLAVELKMRYEAPKVRTVLVTQGFTRTHLSSILSGADDWFSPLLHPETVAERLVNQVLSGRSGNVMVPGSTGLISGNLRALPLWFQQRIRNVTEKQMRPPKTA